MQAGFRTRERRKVAFAASNNSDELTLAPGAVYSIYMPPAFAGAQISLEGKLPDGTWVPVSDPDGGLPVAVLAGEITILPVAIYQSGLEIVRFVSDAVETFTDGILFISR